VTASALAGEAGDGQRGAEAEAGAELGDNDDLLSMLMGSESPAHQTREAPGALPLLRLTNRYVLYLRQCVALPGRSVLTLAVMES
jgi:hypothetical protein